MEDGSFKNNIADIFLKVVVPLITGYGKTRKITLSKALLDQRMK